MLDLPIVFIDDLGKNPATKGQTKEVISDIKCTYWGSANLSEPIWRCLCSVHPHGAALKEQGLPG